MRATPIMETLTGFMIAGFIYYSGKLIQEKVRNLGYLNTFSTYSENPWIGDRTSLSVVFQNTYDSDWLNLESASNRGLTEFYTFKDIEYYTQSYFTLFEKPSGSLTKDYIQERKN